MVEVKNAICGALTKIPAFCNCAPSGPIDATVTCSVATYGISIDVSAHFLPCATPASMGFKAMLGSTQLYSKTWFSQFNVIVPFPVPPAGFELGLTSIGLRGEILGDVSRGRIQTRLAVGVCGKILGLGSIFLPTKCCNMECIHSSVRHQAYINGEPIFPYPFLTGTFDFSKFCV